MGRNLMRGQTAVYQSWFAEGETSRPGRSVGRFFEEIIEDTYRALVQPADLVVDCGANRGVHTWPLSDLVGPEGEVLAIEAIPVLAGALTERLTAEGRPNTRVAATAIG